MGASANSFKQNDCFKLRARPLTLKEVLRLRDGMSICKAPDSAYPYLKHKLANNNQILMALN
jgi:hypothetical protein